MKSWLFPTSLILLTAALLAHAADKPLPDAEQKGYTISAAVNAALEHDPGVRGAREKKNEIEATYRMASSSLFPTLTNTDTAYIKKDQVNLGSSAFGGESYNYYQLQLTASQPLLDMALLPAIRAGDKQLEIAQYDVEIAERELAKNVVQSFYSLLLNQRKLAMLRRTEEVENKILATAKERYRIGRSKILDVLQIKTQLALLDPQISQTLSQIEIASANLANLVGAHNLKVISIHGTLDMPNMVEYAKGLPARLKDAKIRLAELEKISKQLEQISDINSVTLAKHYPRLAMNGTWGRSSYTKSDLMEDYSTAWNVNLQVTIPLFSGLSSFHERKQLASREAQLEIQQSQSIDNASLNQITAEKNLIASSDVIVSSKLASEYARESLVEAEKEYRLSISDLISYLTVETSFLSAETAFDQAKFGFIDSISKFYIASGLPLLEFVQWLDTQGKKPI